MRKYFGYIRVSTARQGERGVSLQEQREAILRYAQAQNLSICEWYEERITAAKAGRPVFSRMLKQLRQGEAEGIVIHKIDRSARNLGDWAHLGELIDAGVDLRFAHEGLDLNSRGGRLSADIQAVVAADFIRNLREETRKGFYGRLKQGIFPLPAPVGYVNNGGGVVKTICPVAGPHIRQAFQLYATGKYSLHSLADLLFARGLRTRPGGKVLHNRLARVLHNPFYTGLIHLKSTGESFPGAHKPLVTQKLFDAVQDVLAGRLPKRSRHHDFLFRRQFTCRNCDNFLIGELQKGRVYYRCHTRGCRLSCVREDELDQAVRQCLVLLQFSPSELTLLREEIADFRHEYRGSREQTLATTRLQSAALQTRLDRLTDAYVDRLLDIEAYKARRESLLQEMNRVRDRLAELEHGNDAIDKTFQRIVELAETLYSTYDLGETAEKRRLLKNIFSNRTVSGKNVEFSMRNPYKALANRPTGPHSAPYRITSRTFRKWLSEVARSFMEDGEAD